MPHAEPTTDNMSAPTVNGTKTNSVTLDHITSYPLVADSLTYYQQNPLGAKSISLANSAYSTFAAPVLPYLQTPYSYVQPYLVKADSIGDDALTKVDDRFPALKSTDYGTLKENAKGAAYYPFKVAGEGRDYVFSTYDDEYKKTAVKGETKIFHTGKAIISTELRIAIDTLHAFAGWVGPKKQHAEEKLEQYKQLGHEQAAKAKKQAQAQK